MEDLAFFVYTHSSYSDCWPLFFNQTKKYLPDFKKYIFVDKELNSIPSNYQIILYNDNDSYQKRMVDCLNQLQENYCFLQHEDMFLYKKPNLELLQQYLALLKIKEIDFIKLIKGGEIRDIPFENSSTLKIIPKDSKWIFTIQPSLWKTKKLIEVYNNAPGKTIWEAETLVQKYCRENDIKGLYHFNNEPKRGKYHFDSDIFPYIATAISKGKWVISEYPELKELLNIYGIDPKIRGTI